ncbi:hypothetical protein L6452_08101 [Arctium lappa]|uniref:Uncharacterized protein n=1 Tax=Arctium lappa TaxID=4217 RepID=A0ACB9DGS8_ARCLA|nr:hypothetical protein L6452_08101 [Arctium lappa]
MMPSGHGSVNDLFFSPGEHNNCLAYGFLFFTTSPTPKFPIPTLKSNQEALIVPSRVLKSNRFRKSTPKSTIVVILNLEFKHDVEFT